MKSSTFVLGSNGESPARNTRQRVSGLVSSFYITTIDLPIVSIGETMIYQCEYDYVKIM